MVVIAVVIEAMPLTERVAGELVESTSFFRADEGIGDEGVGSECLKRTIVHSFLVSSVRVDAIL